MCFHAYYFILTIFVSPAPDVTNLFSHKLAYLFFFKMADDYRKFYDISEQLNAQMDKLKYEIKYSVGMFNRYQE